VEINLFYYIVITPMEDLEKNLFKKGFVKGNHQVLSPENLNELQSILISLRQQETDDGSKKLVDKIMLLGKNSRLDLIIEKILTNEVIKNTLKKALGENYLLRPDCVARFSDANDSGMYIHQDALGETSLAFLVTSQDEGTTAVIPGSHLLIPVKKMRFAEYLSWASPRLFKFTKYFLKPLKGLGGEYYIWFNRLFHGRLNNNNKNTQISLILSFFPVAHPQNNEIVESFKKEILKLKGKHENINSNYLKDLISYEIYKRNIDIFNKSNKKIPLCLNFYSLANSLKSPVSYFSALIKVLLLEIIFWPIYILRGLSKIKKIFYEKSRT
jgi:putative 2OG-Fe(II) oxygenase